MLDVLRTIKTVQVRTRKYDIRYADVIINFAEKVSDLIQCMFVVVGSFCRRFGIIFHQFFQSANHVNFDIFSDNPFLAT